MAKDFPDQEQTKQIFKDTYNFYMKYKHCSTEKEWDECVNEISELSKKHPFELCENILTAIIHIINIKEVVK
jgi:hypothetical protein